MPIRVKRLSSTILRRASLAAGALLAALAPGAAGAQDVGATLRDVPAAGTVAFVDVAVLPMDRERVLAHRTVVVHDGRIVAIGGRGATPVPAGARRVDGRGKFLAPGLMDMHAHLAAGSESLADPAGRQLAAYLATGFTTVRGLGNAPTALSLRDRIARGEVLGPRLVVAGPSLNGRSVASPADGARMVEEQKAKGFDLLKTHGGVSAETYDSIAAAAARVALPLVGHVTPEFGLARAMRAHQQVEHLDGYIAALLADGTPAPDGQMIWDPAVLARVDTAKIVPLARETARLGVWNGPTLALFETVASDETPDALAARPELRLVPAQAVAAWKAQKAEAVAGGPANGRAEFLALRRRIVRALHDAGAGILVGSDSPQFFATPGYGALREIDALVAAGLSPYDALVAATRAPAEYLGWSRDVGTIAVGKRADLVLLDGDPLADRAVLRRPSGVMVAGRWLDRARLDAMLEGVALAVASSRAT